MKNIVIILGVLLTLISSASAATKNLFLSGEISEKEEQVEKGGKMMKVTVYIIAAGEGDFKILEKFNSDARKLVGKNVRFKATIDVDKEEIITMEAPKELKMKK